MLVELKKGTWVSCGEFWDEGFIGCYDVNCNDNDDICCEECILNNVAEVSLEEVGSRMGLTRERVRQLEIKALRKLRSEPRKRALQEAIAW